MLIQQALHNSQICPTGARTFVFTLHRIISMAFSICPSWQKRQFLELPLEILWVKEPFVSNSNISYLILKIENKEFLPDFFLKNCVKKWPRKKICFSFVLTFNDLVLKCRHAYLSISFWGQNKIATCQKRIYCKFLVS